MRALQLRFVDNAFKHGITKDEIREVFLNRDLPCVIVQYKTRGVEKIYNAFGVTEAGRHLVVGFVKERQDCCRIIHANDMKEFERKRFRKLRKTR